MDQNMNDSNMQNGQNVPNDNMQSAENQQSANYQSAQNQQGANYQAPNNQQGANYQVSQNQQEVNCQPANAQPEATVKPKKSAKKWIIAAIIVILALGAGAAAYFGGFFDKEDAKEDKKGGNKGKTAGSIALEQLEPGEATELQFYPVTNFKKKDLEKAAEVMEKRVKLLGDKYEISVDSEKITLKIEKEMLGDSALERSQTVELLKSNGIANIGTEHGSFAYYDEGLKDCIKSVKSVTLDKSEILDVYADKFGEEAYKEIEATENEKFKVAEVTVKSNKVSDFKESFDYFYEGQSICVYHNNFEVTDYENFMGTVVFPDEDDVSVFYLINPAAGFDKNYELIANILQEKTTTLVLDTKIADEPTWETDTKKFGKNQVEKLDGDTVVVECVPGDYVLTYVSDVDFAKHIKKIKNRMDYLDVDYMIGEQGFDNKTICIRVDPEEISLEMIKLVFEGDEVRINSVFDVAHGFDTYELTAEGMGLTVKSYMNKEEIAAETNLGDGRLYLVVNDVTVAQAHIDDLDEEAGTLTFKEFTCFDGKTGADEKKFVKLIASIAAEDYVAFEPESFNIRYFENGKEKTNMNLNKIDWKYSSLTATDEETMQTIRSMGHEVIKHINERNMLIITLDIPRDEDLVVNFFEEVKNVYNACNFDSGAYNKIDFVLKDETKDSPADKFRVEFNKDLYDGKMEYYEYISGTTFFMDYWSDAYEYLEQDSFFTERDFI